ncbi:hypothetical protein [Cryptosporangium arvum]|uniref:hypothetical protein n=1 Tax=Cryptosporangium arvum TaxID=80871 RepID=UPI0004B11910|nr:hypothetical protein [Cryptosporangium arvum]
MLRPVRVPLAFATLVAAASTAYVLFASAAVQRQLDAAGVPGCLDPNVCYPHGAALGAVHGIEITAALTPALIGLVLAAGLLRHAAPLGVALLAGTVLTGVVATVHRLVGARYTVLASDTYEGWQLLHLNHPGFMIMVTLVVTAVGAVAGARATPVPRGRWPLALAGTYAVFALAGVLAWPVAGLFGADGGRPAGPFAADIGLFDGLGYVAGALLAGLLAVLVSAARRERGPAPAAAPAA